MGLDNNPLAAWTYTKVDSFGLVSFHDLTDYLPTYWNWDFGDGDTSTQQNPLHQYAKGGAYWVCLIVGNEYSADTLCKWVYVDGLVANNDINKANWPVSVYPNPTQGDVVNVVIPLSAGGGHQFVLYDMMGRAVAPRHAMALQAGRNTLSVSGLPRAHYVYAIRDADGRVRASGVLQVE